MLLRGEEEGHPHKYTANSLVTHTVAGHGKIQSSDCLRIPFIYISAAMEQVGTGINNSKINFGMTKNRNNNGGNA